MVLLFCFSLCCNTHSHTQTHGILKELCAMFHIVQVSHHLLTRSFKRCRERTPQLHQLGKNDDFTINDQSHQLQQHLLQLQHQSLQDNITTEHAWPVGIPKATYNHIQLHAFSKQPIQQDFIHHPCILRESHAPMPKSMMKSLGGRLWLCNNTKFSGFTSRWTQPAVWMFARIQSASTAMHAISADPGRSMSFPRNASQTLLPSFCIACVT